MYGPTVLDPALLPFALDPELMALLVESAVAFALFTVREQVSPLFFVAGRRLMRVVARMHLGGSAHRLAVPRSM